MSLQEAWDKGLSEKNQKRRREVPISDCGSETVSFASDEDSRAMQDRWDEALSNTDKTYPKDQVIELHTAFIKAQSISLDGGNEWVKSWVEQFKIFINK